MIDIDPGTTVGGLLRELSSIGAPETWDDIMLNVFVAGKIRGFDYVLQSDDVGHLHIPAGGG